MINNNYFGPINYNNKKIPETLFYKTLISDDEYGKPYEHYISFNKKGKITGIIDGTMETINPLAGSPFFPGLKKFKSFYIYYLRSHEHNFGNNLLDFVQKISKKNGGEGRFHLIASDCYNTKKPPHIFYRKYGMDSQYTEITREIDKYIKGEIKLEDINLIDTPMYFIPNKSKQNKTIKFQNIIKKIISKIKKI